MHRNLFFFLLTIFFVFASCKSPEARKPVQRATGSFIKESAKRNKALYKKEKEHIEKIMKAHPEHEYLASESGFWYYYNIKDTTASEMPEIGDVVTITYDIKSLDGTTILSEADTGTQIYKVDLTNQELISGIRDGVKLMKAGEQVTFLFPSYKAFGYYGIENKLGTNVPVQSTVTLQSIEQSQEN